MTPVSPGSATEFTKFYCNFTKFAQRDPDNRRESAADKMQNRKKIVSGKYASTRICSKLYMLYYFSHVGEEFFGCRSTPPSWFVYIPRKQWRRHRGMGGSGPPTPVQTPPEICKNKCYI